MIHRLLALFGNGAELLGAIEVSTNNVVEQKALLERGKLLAGRWNKLQPSEIKAIIAGSITRIEVHKDLLDIQIEPHGLHHVLQGSINDIPPATNSDDPITLSVKAELKRCGMEMKMVVGDGSATTQTGPDHTLISTIIKAHSWWNKLTSGGVKSIRELAELNDSDERYVSKILKLNFLAPEMIETIMAGKQPPELTADTLIKANRMPMKWDEQVRQFGFHE